MRRHSKLDADVDGGARKMTKEELKKSFGDFNSRYFGGRLKCNIIVTDDWWGRL
jgi:hypothetical protein